jgi:hypothetical protein
VADACLGQKEGRMEIVYLDKNHSVNRDAKKAIDLIDDNMDENVPYEKAYLIP